MDATWKISYLANQFINTINCFMQELIDRLQREAGLTTEQAIQSIEVIKNFTKEKFPMFGSAIDSLFADKQADDDFMP